MKYLRKFETLTDYNSATINRPSVSLISTGNELKYDPLLSPGPANNEIWYTGEYYNMAEKIEYFISQTESEEVTITYEGPTILSERLVGNKYVITFDGPVTTIGLDDEDNEEETVGLYPIFFNDPENPISITSITLPNSVTKIDTYSFYGCMDLTSVNIPNNVNYIGHYSFTICTSLASVSIPNNITFIGDSAFNYCTSLESIIIPTNVTRINGYTFSQCSSLTSINIHDNITYIGDEAFFRCTGLTSISIPSSVTEIGDVTFQGCTGLTSFTVNAINPPTLGTSSLTSTNDCPIYVPAQSVDTYKSAQGWSKYATRIQAIS